MSRWRIHATVRDLRLNGGPGPFLIAYDGNDFDAPSDGWAHDVLAAIRQAIEDPAFDYRIGVASSAELAGPRSTANRGRRRLDGHGTVVYRSHVKPARAPAIPEEP